MENQQSMSLASIGGEPLVGSGFETELPSTEDGFQFESLTEDQQEGDQ